MVSKLEILQRFYQIYLDVESDYFTYQGQQYYLCKKNNFTDEYSNYINSLNLLGFIIVNNCFNRPISMDYLLYTYQEEDYQLKTFINQSMIPINVQLEIVSIKESWCLILDEAKAKIGNYASRIGHFEHFVVLSYYYQGLGECAISILNQIKSKKIPAGIEHFDFVDSYKILCCPSNLVIASRIKDLSSAYKKHLITIDELENFLRISNLSSDEIIYLYARLLFPSEFMQLSILDDCIENSKKKKLLNIYQNIDSERTMLLLAYERLNKYVPLPDISWL